MSPAQGQLSAARLAGRRVLVTGAAGFIGVQVCAALVREGAKVIGMVRRLESAASVFERRAVNLLDASAVGRLVTQVRPELIVHLAAHKGREASIAEFRESYDINLTGTASLVEACLVSGCSRFVHLGTCEEYGAIAVPFDEASREAPVTAYGVSKLAATHLLEAVAKNHDFPAVILRPTNVYGPGQRPNMLLPALIESLLQDREFAMTPGEQTRDYIYIDDLVDAIVCALLAEVPAGSILNISAGQPVRMKEVALIAAKCVDLGAVGRLLIGAKSYRLGETMDYWASNARAARLLGWKPRMSLQEGITRTVASARDAAIVA